jgi:gamma-glutamylaminecyclotransferase
MAKTLLFVYGTLKRGGSKSRLMGNSKYVGSASVAPGKTLFTNGNYPMMVESAEGNGVDGEIFEVDERTLASLDRFEGHPNLFKRSQVDINALDGQAKADPMDVHAYVFQRPVSHYEHLGKTFTE